VICYAPRLICVVLCWVRIPKTHNLQHLSINLYGSDTILYWKRLPNTNNLQHLSVSLHDSVLKLRAQYSEFATPLDQFAWFRVGSGCSIFIICNTPREICIVLYWKRTPDINILQHLSVTLHHSFLESGCPIRIICNTSRSIYMALPCELPQLSLEPMGGPAFLAYLPTHLNTRPSKLHTLPILF